ncbi:DUF885 domain-containing protein [Cryptosporangium aurantiacum]|uniref:Uncharacterized conserved protein, DUF885 familyt n=1 Tax=Cryptosporangium aurantiacum TaxID=134849 RepID=A0A1M7Q6T6_9ACTN|nr:DUF885 domain-containing protein [Cryptosporangium aurantiacum]SHN26159.1 Uncharacterized conserved protein, DUF885 familyt [Cryptosporangium aurantiacum]
MTSDLTVTASSLADELLALVCTADPLGASLLGLPGYDDGLADPSANEEARLGVAFGELAERALALDPDGLSEVDRQTRDFIAHLASTERDAAALHTVEWTITDFFAAPAAALVDLLPRVPLVTPEKASGFLDRLGRFPAFLAAVADRHREGLAAGRTPVASLVRAAIGHLDRVLADENLAGLRVPGGPGVTDQEAFTAERDRLLAEAVVPALTAYRTVLQDEILPAGRPDEQPGAYYLPGGTEIYATLARKHTSTHRTPEELHAVGLQIIAALESEYAEIGRRVFGTADQAEIFARLRTDPVLRYASAEEMLEQARSAVARAWAAAPAWFGHRPSTECVVEPVPAAAAPGSPPAYYLPGAIDGSRQGTYFLNTYAPTERFRHTAEVVAFHEAVPGHHFQISIAQEMTGLPLARRLLADTAYAEGWGLYCERLADEMGLYSDDVARLGMLSADSWRAARLVVDTGLHALGWSRDEALTWMRTHTPLSDQETATEIDRYIAYPGQALSYMVGRLELLTLRARASKELGEAFDLKAFHDTVLGAGSLPLAVLGDVVDRWIAGTAR